MNAGSTRWASHIFLPMALLLVCLMPSGDSLWIDEGTTAHYAQQESFSAFLTLLKYEKGSEAQMPFGMLAAWLGAKILGTDSEWTLRAQNILWSGIAVFFLWRAGLMLGMPWLCLVLAGYPFVWTYTNEFRPYAMQIASGSVMLYSLAMSQIQPHRIRTYLAYCLAGGVVLCATSMIGVLTFGAVFLVLATTRRKAIFSNLRHVALPTAPACVMIINLGVYYAWTLSKGAGGAKVWHPGLGNIFFSVYELLGFTGLGPSRVMLRQAIINGTGAAVFKPYIFPIALLAASYAWLFLGWIRRRIRTRRVELPDMLISTVLLNMAFLWAASMLVGFPFWGRHMASSIPFIITALALIVTEGMQTSRPARIISCVIVGLLALSSFSIRFDARHNRDDYKTASAYAVEAVKHGDAVWWCAATLPAEYYGVHARSKSGINVVLNRHNEELNALPLPALIIVSKPDLYDTNGAVRNYTEEHGYHIIYRLMAFKIYAKKQGSSAHLRPLKNLSKKVQDEPSLPKLCFKYS